MSLEFYFQDCISEIDAISNLAGRFLNRDTHYVLPQLQENLRNIRSAAEGRTYDWGIPLHTPLMTATSNGNYEHGGGGGHSLRACITSTWTIEAQGANSNKYLQKRKFRLAGKASTRVRLIDDAGHDLAMWRIEIADPAAPGVYFHIQVLGEVAESPFPNSLPIPRFPSLFATPVVVLEFVLAELFQDDWRQAVSKESANLQRWRSIQAQRLVALFEWQLGEARRNLGSPWTTIKVAQPPSNLFLG